MAGVEDLQSIVQKHHSQLVYDSEIDDGTSSDEGDRFSEDDEKQEAKFNSKRCCLILKFFNRAGESFTSHL